MAERDHSKHFMQRFTKAGRLLIMASVVVAGGLLYWNITFINDHFPNGRYPIFFIVIPVLIGSALFHGIAYSILRLLGVKLTKDAMINRRDPHRPASAPGILSSALE